jgi:pimeloyl-ACP methyl ester carboxylesterase
VSRLRSFAKGAAYAGGAIGAIGGALYTAEVLAARRVRRRDDPGAADILAPIRLPTRTVTSFDGARISVVEVGEGTPLVLVHGVTLSVRTWVLQYAALPALGYRVIAIDQRGHGSSTLGDDGHAVEHLGDDLAAVVRELDLRDAVLVGHSMGGIAVQSFAMRHRDLASERIRGIVLLSTLCKTPVGSQSTQLRNTIERITRRTPDTTRLWAAKNLGFLLARVGFGREPYESEVELVRQMLRDCPNATRVNAPRALIGMDLTSDLAKIETPTLVICGTADAITPPFHAHQLHDAIQGSRLEMVDGGGHMLMLERAEWLHETIDAFAREVGAR